MVIDTNEFVHILSLSLVRVAPNTDLDCERLTLYVRTGFPLWTHTPKSSALKSLLLSRHLLAIASAAPMAFDKHTQSQSESKFRSKSSALAGWRVSGKM